MFFVTAGIIGVLTVIGGFALAVWEKRNEAKFQAELNTETGPETEPEPESKPETEAETEAEVKPVKVASGWPEGYVFERNGGNFAWEKDSQLAEMYANLEKVDTTNPNYREQNELDVWFNNHVADFCEHPEFLAYISKYNHLVSRFMKHLGNAEHNSELQKNLASIVHNTIVDSYHPNCKNLLCHYLKSWDLEAEIKKVIAEDDRFMRVKELYETRYGKIDLS